MSVEKADSVGRYLLYLGGALGFVALIASTMSAYLLYWSSSAAQQASEVKIAELNLKARRAELETQTIKERVSWRALTKEQHDTLVKMLTGKKFKVLLAYSVFDAEAMGFRDDFERSFKDAGLQTARNDTLLQSNVGLAITNEYTPERAELAAAFKAAGIAFDDGDAGDMFQHQLTVVIGTKPRPF